MSTLSASTGKSTLLDILWWTRKSGEVSGTKIVGYVDRDSEDTLMSTLTIDDEAWKFRMLEMLTELG
ncbi:hypothetical protein BDN70DRAFT_888229, partial [Pholiota conissans]